MSTRRATTRTAPAAPAVDDGQLDLFAPAGAVPAPRTPAEPTTAPAGASTTRSAARPAVVESNDLDLIRHVAGNAGRGIYLLVGTSERVYARTDTGPGLDTAARVPAYEEAAVHQLIASGWLTTGNGHHRIRCGAALLTGTAVLSPKSTRARVARWEAMARPASWAPDPHHDRTRRT
jgi:hypothetical protein